MGTLGDARPPIPRHVAHAVPHAGPLPVKDMTFSPLRRYAAPPTVLLPDEADILLSPFIR